MHAETRPSPAHRMKSLPSFHISSLEPFVLYTVLKKKLNQEGVLGCAPTSWRKQFRAAGLRRRQAGVLVSIYLLFGYKLLLLPRNHKEERPRQPASSNQKVEGTSCPRSGAA